MALVGIAKMIYDPQPNYEPAININRIIVGQVQVSSPENVQELRSLRDNNLNKQERSTFLFRKDFMQVKRLFLARFFKAFNKSLKNLTFALN